MNAAGRRLIIVMGCMETGNPKLLSRSPKHWHFAGEIVSTDSMQIYEGLDIITNKVTSEETEGVPHHLMSFLSPLTFGYTVTQFRARALAVIEDIWARDKLPILVGGTGYYTESLLWNVLIDDKVSRPDERPCHSSEDNQDSDSSIDQDASNSEAATTSTQASVDSLMYLAGGLPPEIARMAPLDLYKELQRVDPERARQLHPNDCRRVVRGLQLWYRTGVKQSDRISEKATKTGVSQGGDLGFPTAIGFWIQCNNDVLIDRLNGRVDTMVEQGLEEEITTFYDLYHSQHEDALSAATDVVRTIGGVKGVFQSIGFKEFMPFLKLSHDERRSDAGRDTFKQCCVALQIANRQYARRQIRRIRGSFLEKPNRSSPPLYSLDSTDLDAWDTHVGQRATRIVSAYLSDTLPLNDITPLPVADRDSPNINITTKCVACERYISGAQQWEAHLRSKGHRARAKKAYVSEMSRLSEDELLMQAANSAVDAIPDNFGILNFLK